MDIIEIQKTYMFNSKQYGYVGACGESGKELSFGTNSAIHRSLIYWCYELSLNMSNGSLYQCTRQLVLYLNEIQLFKGITVLAINVILPSQTLLSQIIQLTFGLWLFACHAADGLA